MMGTAAHAVRAAVGAALEIAVLGLAISLVYVAYIQSFGGSRLFYDGLVAILVGIAGVLTACLLIGHARARLVQPRFYSSLAAACLAVYAFHITIPTIIDRSISLFILSRVDDRAGTTLEEMQATFLDGYVSDYDAVCRRVDEQLASGNIELRGERYVLTPNGSRILASLESVASLFGQEQYFITSTQGKLPYSYEVRGSSCLRAPVVRETVQPEEEAGPT